MTDSAIRVEGIGKKYRIGHVHEAYRTLRDTISDAVKSPFRRLASFGQASSREEDTIWALRGISFEVGRGEVVGIIGGNGAGKSTLLKILTRITPPTEGRAVIRGHVASLLEVGTGFHQELTGRENVFLSGAILGMPRREVARKMDEIVEFSEIGKFIDTPVKRYSSGMTVRLGFAVAAYLEPEVLLVDEVLAVGDAKFQKRSMARIRDAASEGRTILLVSHRMGAIGSMCSRAILLEGGRLVLDGTPAEAIERYLHGGARGKAETVFAKDPRAGSEVARLQAVRIRLDDGGLSSAVGSNRRFAVEIAYEVLQTAAPFDVGIYLHNSSGVHVLTSLDRSGRNPDPVAPGTYSTRCWFPADLLAPDIYSVTVQAKVMRPAQLHFRIPGAITFSVTDTSAAYADVQQGLRGVIRPALQWEEVVDGNPAQLHR